MDFLKKQITLTLTSLIPRPLPDLIYLEAMENFLYSCEIKIWEWPGNEVMHLVLPVFVFFHSVWLSSPLSIEEN